MFPTVLQIGTYLYTFDELMLDILESKIVINIFIFSITSNLPLFTSEMYDIVKVGSTAKITANIEVVVLVHFVTTGSNKYNC